MVGCSLSRNVECQLRLVELSGWLAPHAPPRACACARAGYPRDRGGPGARSCLHRRTRGRFCAHLLCAAGLTALSLRGLRASVCARGILVIARGRRGRSTRGRPCTHFSCPSGLAASPRPGLQLHLLPSTRRPGGLAAGSSHLPRLVPAGRPHLLPRWASALAGHLARRTWFSDRFRKPAGASPFWKISF